MIASYFNENNISIFPWSARSPELGIIEDCWEELIHGVYADGKQYQHVQESKNAFVRIWDTLSQNYTQKLYKLISNRTIEVIENKGGCTIIKQVYICRRYRDIEPFFRKIPSTWARGDITGRRT